MSTSVKPDNTQCDCPWDDVKNRDTSIGGFRDPDPSCRKCGGTGTKMPHVLAAELLCVEPSPVGSPTGIGYDPVKHWDKCACKGTGLRYPELSDPCGYMHNLTEEEDWRGRACQECSNTWDQPPGRIPNVTLSKVLPLLRWHTTEHGIGAYDVTFSGGFTTSGVFIPIHCRLIANATILFDVVGDTDLSAACEALLAMSKAKEVTEL